MRLSKFSLFLLPVLAIVACSVWPYTPNPRPTATPNNIATDVIETRATAATLTRELPTETPQPLPTTTPDNIATSAAETRAFAATLTASAPTVVLAPTMTPIPMATATRAHMAATVDYSTFFGGNGNTWIYGVAVCSDGSVVATGATSASNLPVTPGALDTTFDYTVPGDDNTIQDSFVGKFDATGALEFLTYLGGNSGDRISAIAVDDQCSIYLTGYTESDNFPTTENAYDRTFNGDGRDTFVTKLSSDGRTLLYSTYLGGTNWDYGYTIAVDTAHNAYVGGFTHGGYPVTAGAADVTFGSPGDGFVAKLNADGSQLVYATYIGRGGEWDYVSSIAVDNLEAVYVPNAEGYLGGGVTKISPTGRRFVYSTPLPAFPAGLAVDSQHNVYFVGEVSAENDTDFPVTADAFQSTYGGGERDLTIAKLDQNGILIYGSYFGGNGLDTPGNNFISLAIDAAQNIYFTGSTNSTNFPLAQPFQSALGGNYDTFVVKFNVATGPVLSSYLGGSAGENSYKGNFNCTIAADNFGGIYLAGRTDSADFPTTPDAFDTTFSGPAYDGFLTKISSH
jgi:hypothetical protein